MGDKCPCIDCITLPICISEMRKDLNFAIYDTLRPKCKLLYNYCKVSDLIDKKKKIKALKKVFKCDYLGLGCFIYPNPYQDLPRSILLHNIKKKLFFWTR